MGPRTAGTSDSNSGNSSGNSSNSSANSGNSSNNSSAGLEQQLGEQRQQQREQRAELAVVQQHVVPLERVVAGLAELVERELVGELSHQTTDDPNVQNFSIALAGSALAHHHRSRGRASRSTSRCASRPASRRS